MSISISESNTVTFCDDCDGVMWLCDSQRLDGQMDSIDESRPGHEEVDLG